MVILVNKIYVKMFTKIPGYDIEALWTLMTVAKLAYGSSSLGK